MSAPAWLPSAAYLAGAVVRPTAAALPMYRATAAGTSGITEPAWPTGAPWTVADGATLVWTLNTTFRQQVKSVGILPVLTAWRLANPTLLRKVWPVRPPSYTLGELPCAVLGGLSESIVNMNGLTQRSLDAFTVELVDRVPDNAEAAERMDVLIDALLDYLVSAYHSASGTSIVEPIGVTDGDTGLVSEGPVRWYSNLVTFRAYVAEGSA